MKLSVQLYSVRNQCAQDLVGTLKALSDIGLQYVELAGFHGRSAGEWRELLENNRLLVSGMHAGVESLETDVGVLIADCKTLANRYVIIPGLPESYTRAGWRSCAKRLEEFGRTLKPEGLVLAYHNHSDEFKVEGEKPGLQVLFDSSDPDLVAAQIDTYWVHWGGHDPASWIRKLSGRVPLVHLKDGLDGAEPRDAEAGKGALDWDPILLACEEAGVEFGAIEFDDAPRDPFDSIKASYDFFRSKGLR